MAFVATRSPLKRTIPYWVYPGAVLDIDFLNDRSWQAAIRNRSASSTPLSITRTTVGYAQQNNGVWLPYASGLFRRTDRGILIEEAATNLVLWCRDLTNAAWAKVNTTASLTATGIDGVANSASILTATSSGGTALQVITLSSATRVFSAWVRRRTGSGTVSITQDGVAWTDITSQINSSTYTRVTFSAAQLNPVVGFQLATSGDSVDVDFTALQVSLTVSPILTTTASATRNADVVTATVTALGLTGARTTFVQAVPNSPTGYGSNQIALSLDDGTTAQKIQSYRAASTGSATPLVDATAGSALNTGIAVWAAGAVGRMMIGTQVSAQGASFNGSAIQTATVAGVPAQATILHIGCRADGALQFNGYIQRAGIIGSKVSNPGIVTWSGAS